MQLILLDLWRINYPFQGYLKLWVEGDTEVQIMSVII